MARIELQKQNKLSKKWIISGLLFAFFLIASSILLLLYPFASKEKEEYFNGKNPILFEGLQVGNAMVDGKAVYVPLSFMQKYIDDSITFDEKSQSIIITTKDKVVQMPTKSLTYYINEKPVKLQLSPIKDQNGEMFLALEPLLAYYPFEISILPDTNAVWIKKDGQKIQYGSITKENVHAAKLSLRKEPDLQSPYFAATKPGEKIQIDGEKGEYLYVRKESGEAGFVKKDFVSVGKKQEIVVEQTQPKAKLKKINGPIHLTWEAVYTLNPDTDRIPHMPGVNVVSPTWFELADENGSIHNLGSLEYSKWAHKKGYQVWGLFSNAFDPEMTHEAFKNFTTRQKMIRQLLHYSQMFKLNGINVDIENVKEEDGPLITQFIREATPYFHEAGLTVSMDVTFISEGGGNWSAFYEREKLAKIVDYIAVMAYDEHWGSSPVAGSVASLPWVETNLQKMLEVVPNEKLILGVPLYTRLWEVKDKGEVSSKAISMEAAKKWLKSKKLKPTYDTATGQNYAEYYSKKKKTTYKIWLEDESSLMKRADLANQYKLAGVGSWSRFFGDEDAWTALDLSKKSLTKK